jgi:hypothetical protein
VDASTAQALRTAVLAVDPHGTFATPVVTSVSGTEDGPRTTAIEPAAFSRIALWADAAAAPTPAALTKLSPKTADPVRLTGDVLETTVTSSVKRARGQGEETPPPVAPVHLLVAVTNASTTTTIDLGRLLERGTRTYRAVIPCTAGCTLRTVAAQRTFGDFGEAEVSVHMLALRAGPQGGTLASIDLGPVDDENAWQPAADQFGDTFTGLDTRHPLFFSGTTFGDTLAVQRGDVPVLPPVIAVGNVLQPVRGPQVGPRQAQAPDLSGNSQLYATTSRLAQVPRSGSRGVLVDLALTAPTAGPPTSQTTYSVWLAADDKPREQKLVAALERRGVLVTGRDSVADHEHTLASQGPTLALRLALLAGVVALVLAGAVLVVGIATSGASRARDLAGLRLVGVPARAVRAAAVREHVTVAVLGVAAGAVLGLVAAEAALPRIPLFSAGGPRLDIVREPAWGPVSVAALACLVLLVVVSVLVGRSLAAGATPDRLREGR